MQQQRKVGLARCQPNVLDLDAHHVGGVFGLDRTADADGACVIQRKRCDDKIRRGAAAVRNDQGSKSTDQQDRNQSERDGRLRQSLHPQIQAS